jgi:nicotinamide-nucleotide amidase
MAAALYRRKHNRRDHLMRAEIVAIGDELTSGQILDTNTQWLSQRLQELGIRVVYHTAVGDQLESIAQVIRQAVGRADLVVATGGLGPTADDLAREAIAQATGRPLVLDQESLKRIRQLYARRKRAMPQQNERQAWLPTGSRPIPNPHGTAPGIAMEVLREGAGPCHLFALPGVPAEMKELWHQAAVGVLRAAGAGRRVIRHRVLKCFGAGESNVEAMLPDLIRRGRRPQVGINASQTTIILRITGDGATPEECDALVEPTVATIRACLGTLVFGEGDEELQHAVIRLLLEKNQTLATAEWGTGGMLADWLSEVAGADRCYLGGVVVAGDAALQRALSVPADLIAQYTARSSEVVRAMAAGCRSRFGADFGLATGRFPEPDPAAPEPRPTFVGLAARGGVEVRSFPFAGHPATLKVLSAKRALNVARLAMMEAFHGQ